MKGKLVQQDPIRVRGGHKGYLKYPKGPENKTWNCTKNVKSRFKTLRTLTYFPFSKRYKDVFKTL